MIKVNILNLKRFLETVNQCHGRIMVLSSDGQKMNITREYAIQKEMEKRYLENGRCLPLSLIIEESKDYMAVISYYAGDC